MVKLLCHYHPILKRKPDGYGGSVSLESFNNDHFVAKATIGYLSFQGKRADLDEYEYEYDAKASMLPIQIGLKYYPKVIRKHSKGVFYFRRNRNHAPV